MGGEVMIQDKLDKTIRENYLRNLRHFNLEVSSEEYEQLYLELANIQHMSMQPEIENGKVVYRVAKMPPLMDRPTIYYCNHCVVIKD